MAEVMDVYRICKIFGLCLLWYIISASNNIVGKVLLSSFPYPVTVTMAQLISTAVYSVPILRITGVSGSTVPWQYWLKLILPLSIGKFLASVSSHISIWKVPVSYAHTVKATMPLFVVVLSRIVMHEKQTTMVYLSLLPIVLGVIIASLTEINFQLIGLTSALGATLGFSLLNVFAKKVLKETNMHHLRLLHTLAKISSLCFLPIWLLIDVRSILSTNSGISYGNSQQTMLLLAIDGFLSFAQNFVAFNVLHLVSSLSYSVANATKRISVITASLLFLQNPVTPMNVFGMFMAVSGVLFYNKAKLDQHKEEHRKSVLPYTKSDTHLLKLANKNDYLFDLQNKNGFHTNKNTFHQSPSTYGPTAMFQQESNLLLNGVVGDNEHLHQGAAFRLFRS